MVKNEIMAKVGSWAFLFGILIAVLSGLYYAYTLEANDVEVLFNTELGSSVAWVLVFIGIIIGILTIFGKGTITKKEIPGFLFAGIALIVMGGVFNAQFVSGLGFWIGSLLHGIAYTVSIFVAPAVGILSLKAIWDMGKDI